MLWKGAIEIGDEQGRSHVGYLEISYGHASHTSVSDKDIDGTSDNWPGKPQHRLLCIWVSKCLCYGSQYGWSGLSNVKAK